MTQHDEINYPKHYELAPGLEAWDVIKATLTREELRGYCLGNLLKYRLRAGEKGDAAKCLAKANWYRDQLREMDALAQQMKGVADDLRLYVDGLTDGFAQQVAQAQEESK